MMPKDPRLIPAGAYCYRVVGLRDGEELPTDFGRFGNDLREAGYHRGRKRVLCPYWQVTDHGTIRCDYLDLEVLDESDRDARRQVAEHFGTGKAAFRIGTCCLLADEVKVCEINVEDEDGDAC